MFANHDRIDDQREVELLGALVDGIDRLGGSQSAGFGDDGLDVIEYRVELIEDQFGREVFDTSDPEGVLGGDHGHDRSAVDTELLEGLQVGLESCAAAWV